MPAIKRILIDDGYPWDDTKLLLTSLTRACWLVNDHVKTRLPIQCRLLELILFEVQRAFRETNKIYLQVLFQALFALGYYGLFRVGELTTAEGNHTVKAKDIHISDNGRKMLIILHLSKTHSQGMRPQKIRIVANSVERSGKHANKNFCQIELTQNFLRMWGSHYKEDDEHLFIYRDGTPVSANQARKLLNLMIERLGLDSNLYGFHSFRVGRTTDLIKFSYSFEEVKCMGRWKSNVIYKYIRQ